MCFIKATHCLVNTYVIMKSQKTGKCQKIAEDLRKHLNNEYDALLAVPGSFKKIVVINKPLLSYTNKDGILIISLEEFLLNQNSLDL